jgi:hypothetical protein
MALEGDVVPSRLQAPLNITQIGGYLNLLTTLNETAMRSQVLAGILGVAGPVNAAGWTKIKPPHSFRMILNDRPAGVAQASIPVVVPIRSDFAYGLLHAIKGLHDQGCVLPLLGGPTTLPTSVLDPSQAVDPMPYLGRSLTLAAATALVQPSSDALVLARSSGSTDLFQAACNSINAATVAVAAADYDALQGTSTGVQIIPLAASHLVYVNPVLSAAGFYPATPLPQPTSAADTAWARYSNITGLVAGQTRLGDELSMLYSWTDIGASIFSNMSGFVWNGTMFASH